MEVPVQDFGQVKDISTLSFKEGKKERPCCIHRTGEKKGKKEGKKRGERRNTMESAFLHPPRKGGRTSAKGEEGGGKKREKDAQISPKQPSVVKFFQRGKGPMFDQRKRGVKEKARSQ